MNTDQKFRNQKSEAPGPQRRRRLGAFLCVLGVLCGCISSALGAGKITPAGYYGHSDPLVGLTAITPVLKITRNLVSASGVSWSTVTFKLNKTGIGTGLTWAAGDTIAIAPGTAGINPGYYEVDPPNCDNDNIALIDSCGTTGGGVVLIHGFAPLNVGTEATGTTGVGVSNPFDMLEHGWNYGDSGNIRTFQVRSYLTGQLVTKNPNTDQKKPLGMYVYNKPGSYTITYNVRGWIGGTNYSSANSTISLTVAAWPEDTDFSAYFDSVGGNDANDGRDAWGLNISGGFYDPATGIFTKVGAFTNYDHAAATADDDQFQWYNRIYISSAGKPALNGHRTISSKISNDALQLATGLCVGTASDVASSTGPKQTRGAVETYCNSGNNKRAFLKRGSNFTATASIVSNDGCAVFAYGSGANPIHTRTVDVTIFGQSGSRNACAVCNQTIVDAGAPLGDSAAMLYALRSSDLLIYNTLTTNCHNPFQGGGSSRIWWWGFDQTMTTDPAIGKSMMPLPTVTDWFYCMGGTSDGGYRATFSTLTHQLYLDTSTGTRPGIMAWRTFKNGVNSNFCANVNVSGDTALDAIRQRYFVITGCDFSGLTAAVELSNANNDATLERASDVIVDECCFHCGDGTTIAAAVQGITTERLTIRRNGCWNNNQIFGAGYSTRKNRQFNVYENNAYLTLGDGATLFDTLAQSGGAFRYNTIQSTAAASASNYCGGRSANTATYWTVTGNQYWAPNMAGNPVRNLAIPAAEAVSAWNLALTAVDVAADPKFTNPALGDFSVKSTHGASAAGAFLMMMDE